MEETLGLLLFFFLVLDCLAGVSSSLVLTLVLSVHVLEKSDEGRATDMVSGKSVMWEHVSS